MLVCGHYMLAKKEADFVRHLVWSNKKGNPIAIESRVTIYIYIYFCLFSSVSDIVY